jgi:O-antigen/teichoic acid export membrane protein
MGLINMLTYWCNRQRKYAQISVSRITQAFFAAAGKLSLFAVYSGLIIGTLIGSFFALAVLFYKLPFLRFSLKWNDIKRIAFAFKTYPCFMIPTVLLNNIGQQLPVILICSMASAELGGFYSIAVTVMNLPATTAGGAISQIFIEKFSRKYHGNDFTGAKNLLLKTWKKLFIIGVVPFSLLFFFGPLLFSIVFGAKWYTAGLIASIIAPVSFLGLLVSPTSGIYLTMGMEKYSSVYGAVALHMPILIAIGMYYDKFWTGLIIAMIVQFILVFVYGLIGIKKLTLSCKQAAV